MQYRATEAIACRPGSQSCIAAKPVASQACLLLPSSKERVQKAKGRKDGKKAGVISVGLAGMMTVSPDRCNTEQKRGEGGGEQQWECWEGIHATLRGNTGLQAFNKLPAITSSFAAASCCNTTQSVTSLVTAAATPQSSTNLSTY
ncbi:unnamed protein product [Sphagnum jensenii]|uniref:Uncharacterized protein n=1 Tax=Sphagnum jensenii TaxID=128206 RepID=A0ABP0VNE5_9BRYO